MKTHTPKSTEGVRPRLLRLVDAGDEERLRREDGVYEGHEYHAREGVEAAAVRTQHILLIVFHESGFECRKMMRTANARRIDDCVVENIPSVRCFTAPRPVIGY